MRPANMRVRQQTSASDADPYGVRFCAVYDRHHASAGGPSVPGTWGMAREEGFR
jgi:hypothetical protein